MKTVLLIIAFWALPWEMATQPPEISVESSAHLPSACSDTFVEHRLDHTTAVQDVLVRFYDSNGAGLAINDLDNDGLPDIVLANLDGPSTILWNLGHLGFETQDLNTIGKMRGVASVDVDGDGWLDIVFTHQLAAPGYWHNQRDRSFQYQVLPGVSEYAYAMNWADLDRDGDLDLVTASYDIELEQRLGNDFMFSDGAGVYYYENDGTAFIPTRLSEDSQALVVFLDDINGDGDADILVGNDFAVRDQVWYHEDGHWTPAEPFLTMTHSTMSMDAGDINNDGSQELYAADMKPYSEDPAVLADWQPVMDLMANIRMLPDDPQIMENVLQMGATSSGFNNQATAYAVDASGWSWSSKFGDLNSDGFLDLYVVNGMIAFDLFGYLPNSELVEENQVFRNIGGTGFAAAPEWGLASTRSGRGMSMADLDQDGDLDIVINNLQSAAQLFENQLCAGHNLTLALRMDQGANRFALGARAVLHTSIGTLTRDLRAVSGYLSGDPAVLHFGFDNETVIYDLEVIWPDGQRSVLEDLTQDRHLRVTRQS